MIAAAIDIGTNTTLALLAETSADGLKPLQDQLTVNRLGDALQNGPQLSREIIALNVDLLAELQRDFRRAGAEAFAVCGTSALRRAENRRDFIAAVHGVTGLQVEIIAGRDEAALTYMGAVSGREIYPGERVCVMDIGGGSTEIVEGRGYVPGQGYSMDVGATTLTNEFLRGDPPDTEEIAALRADLRGRLPQLVKPLTSGNMPWVLVGGTAVTLAIIKADLKRYEPQRVGGALLTAEDVERQLAAFSNRSAAELQNLPGMPVGRGRSIRAGAILLSEMFSALQIQQGVVSERGLRHGLWLARFGERESS